ncbi:carboxypeptidase-like regulatory domain-containing protein [Capnocytophaga canimorsus]|uniref:carboxypeptidase-like regulatory domain-containing protein n=1 Tax=Capnocytophaga canimorsus TaxID=28188 RepID=UPI0037D453A0
MKKILFLLVGLFCSFLYGQQPTEMQGNVFSMQSGQPMANVHILNLNKVSGVVTDEKGDFTIRAQVNDTLYLSFLGYKSLKVKITNDMLKFPGTKIGMTELAYALEEVIISPHKLTGYLDIDAKYIPIDESVRYSVSGLELGYEGRPKATTIGRVFNAIFNPADFLYRTFGAKGREMRKLEKIRKDNELSDMLASRYDRETLIELLQIDRNELEEMIRSCNYSNDFIMTANDLQILEAISNCYEEYRVLNRNKKK